MIRFANNRSNSVTDLQDKLADYGKFVGSRLLDVIVLREKGYRRETKLLNMLMFVKGTVWKNLFNKEADKLERSNDDPCQYLLIEKEPIVNTYISVPKDKGGLNCASFIAGIVEAILQVYFCLFSALLSSLPKMLTSTRRLFIFARHAYFSAHLLRSTVVASGSEQTPELLNSATESQPSTSTGGSAHHSSLKRISLVPARIHRHLFGDGPTPSNVSEDIYESLELPELYGSNLQEHFYKLGEMQTLEYRKQLDLAANMRTIPNMPKKWAYQAGWTKYNSSDGKWQKVEYPEEKLLFFDVEVCVTDGQLPTLAVALSPTAWYSWCSDRLIHNTPVPELCRLNDLIPLEPDGGSKNAKIVIGHNVAYDRSRVREQYLRRQTATRFWDTMSMAIPIYGMADHQMLLYEKNDLEEDERGHAGWVDDWKARVCKNSLAALHEKLCSQKSEFSINKSMQSFFVNEPIEEIRDNFQDLVRYCAEDVVACREIYQMLYTEFVERFPHPVTWQGMLEMSAVYLPITSNWRRFYSNCEHEAFKQNQRSTHGVIRAAQELANALLQNQRFKQDAWMWHEDWSCRNCAMPTWYTSLLKSKKLASTPIEELSAADVKLKSRVIPRLFGLCWGPYPLHFKADKGWGFLVPKVLINDTEAVPEISKASLRRGEEVDIPNRAILDVIAENIANGVGEVLLGEPACSVGAFNFHKLPHPVGVKFCGSNVV
ncbi:unnamed protein product [Toxocara canis]|uniref:DNA-directed DNA polymerase n=1 Tax=Toxocara canis TaxID=6265 RepID=A0A183UWN1_TOXCA|nr:unnamed protein product [Toxocara canis]